MVHDCSIGGDFDQEVKRERDAPNRSGHWRPAGFNAQKSKDWREPSRAGIEVCSAGVAMRAAHVKDSERSVDGGNADEADARQYRAYSEMNLVYLAGGVAVPGLNENKNVFKPLVGMRGRT